jgi:ABC-type antimicrobial peptide transport system permease subunit
MGCNNKQTATVIGVVNNSAIRSLGEVPRPQVFVPFARLYAGGLTAILLETTTPPARLVDTVRRTLVELGQGMRVYTVEPLSDHVDKSYAPIRWQSTVLTAFGLLALILAAVGLYGVIAYRVALRTRESGCGWRSALRAGVSSRRSSDRGCRSHWSASRSARCWRSRSGVDWLCSMRTFSHLVLLVLAITGMIWIAVALLATYVPAARASSVNPLIALRYE